MTIDLIIRWVRAIILLGLVAFFSINLCVGLLRDEQVGGFGRLQQGTGQDPGIRVLLANRFVAGKEVSEALPTHEAIELTMYQTVDIVTPDDPDNPERRLSLPAGAKMTVLTDVSEGLILSSRDWGIGGKEIRWEASRIYVMPQNTVPAAADEAAKNAPARRDPSSLEAANADAVFGLQGRRYRGCAEIEYASPKDMRLINCLPIEAYVDGVVAVEMSSGYPLEALKAQAIISRSYGYARAWRSRNAGQRFDVVDGVNDQDYRGTGHGPPLITRAVVETRGIVTFTDLANGSFPFAPLFSASSGGFTASVDSVFPNERDVYGQPLPPGIMPAQPDPYCQPGAEGLGKAQTHWQTTEVLTPGHIRAELRKLAERTGDSRLNQIGFIKDVRVGKRSTISNRVDSVQIHHTLGEPIEISAHVFRMAMGPSRIRSTLWSPDSPKRIDSTGDRIPKDYQITSLGWGHGVGMSQISAWEMARQNWLAKNILLHFYPRVILRTLW
jgi:SpoIID/LytB domain protein